MKKTFIALLLVLAIVSVNVFADDATIIVKASTKGKTLFGVSAVALESSDYASESAFTDKALATIDSTGHALTEFQNEAVNIGYFSGFNTTGTAVMVYVSTKGLVLPFETEGVDDVVIPLTISTDDDNDLESLEIPAANHTLGILESTLISVKATTSTDIDVAPAGNYEAVITFSFTAP